MKKSFKMAIVIHWSFLIMDILHELLSLRSEKSDIINIIIVLTSGRTFHI